MPDLNFAVESALATPFSASPLLTFRLSIRNGVPGEPIHAVLLRCQVRIDPTRRHYQSEEQQGLRDLFGEPGRWGRTLRSMLWTHANVMVPSFTDAVEVDLPITCTFDFNVAVTKYFHALRDGEVPLVLLFSGTIFHEDEGSLRVAQVPWEKEATYRLPVRIWREMMDQHYPNSAWLCLRRDAFDRLGEYKIRHGIPTWEQAIQTLLDVEGGR